MKRALNSLQECLFDAFADFCYSDPQAPRQLWAIREGLRRVDPGSYRWREVQARKDHDCMRGHKICRGEIYFQYQIGAGWGNDWKFCAGCMAMILYFQCVKGTPPIGSSFSVKRKGFPTQVEPILCFA